MSFPAPFPSPRAQSRAPAREHRGTSEHTSVITKVLRADVVAALTLLAVHTILVWGYTGPFWGDVGRWSHEVERFALGEVPYRDFQWHFPPLALWIEGYAARVFGTGRTQLSAIATCITVVIATAYVLYVRRLLRRIDVPLILAGLLLALAYAQSGGAALQLGSYSPPTIVGAAAFAIEAALFVRRLESGDRSAKGAYGMAAFAACAVLTKHDFWAPSGYIMLADLLRSRRVTPGILAATLTAAGFSIVIGSVGWTTFVAMLGGFNHVRTSPGKGFPSWERLTIECFVLSLIALGVFTLASVARRRIYVAPLVAAGVSAALAGGVHVMQTMHTVGASPNEIATPTQLLLQNALARGESLRHFAFWQLRTRAGTTPLPVLLPFALLALMALRWRNLPVDRRVTVAILLGLCIALRLRRAFEASDWHEFLFSLPVYLVATELLLSLDGDALRKLRLSIATTLPAFALWANYEFGRGPLTSRYYAERYETARGVVHWAPGQAADFDRIRVAMDSIDPAGDRPLVAFGFTGGWNYFLNRRNPFPFTQDFYFSAFNADSLLRTRPPHLFLIDDSFIEGMSYPAKGQFWNRWEQSRAPSPYGPYDRPRFNRLLQGCTEVPKVRTRFRLYDCP